LNRGTTLVIAPAGWWRQKAYWAGHNLLLPDVNGSGAGGVYPHSEMSFRLSFIRKALAAGTASQHPPAGLMPSWRILCRAPSLLSG